MRLLRIRKGSGKYLHDIWHQRAVTMTESCSKHLYLNANHGSVELIFS